VPYMVTVDRQNGAAAQPVAAQAFKPDATVRTYFLTQWVEKLLTLDPYQTEKNIKVAYSLTRDKASREFTEFMQADKPIERLVKDRTLTRVPIINSINPGSDDGIAFVRVTTEERSGAGAPTAKSFMLTIHYVLVPPTSEAELRVNPLGMFITHFVKSDELGS
jgi:type IV secretory pathway TrbF-like protein